MLSRESLSRLEMGWASACWKEGWKRCGKLKGWDGDGICMIWWTCKR